LKQVVVLGDLTRWSRETEFINDLLTYTGMQSLTVNTDHISGAWDMNQADISGAFPAESLAVSTALLIRKLYAQGLLDGILTFADDSWSSQNDCLDSIPFGVPVFILAQGGQRLESSPRRVNIWLPGHSFNFNTMVKIAISNAVFALSGMMLNSIYNYGTSRAQVAVVAPPSTGKSIGQFLLENSLDYLLFPQGDACLNSLVRDGYIHGLLICQDLDQTLTSCIQGAMERDTPVVLVQQQHPPRLPDNLPSGSKLVLVSARGQIPPQQEMFKLQTLNFSPGSPKLLQAAAKTLVAQIK
jgi:hypothetical protein